MPRSIQCPLLSILKRLPLRAVLSIPFLVQILLAVVLVDGLSSLNGQQTVNNLLQQRMEDVHDRVQQHLQAYTELPQQMVQLVADDVESGRVSIEIEDFRALDSYFLRRIQTFQTARFLYVGNQQGRFIGAASVYKNDKLSHLIEVSDATTDGRHISYVVSAAGKRLYQFSTVPSNDPRRCSWYQTAAAKGTATWSEIYPFAGPVSEGLIITAVRPLRDVTGQLTGVAAADLHLNDVDTFLQGLGIAQSGQVFILEPTGAIVASSQPRLHTAVKGQVKRSMATSSSNPLMQSTVEQIEHQLGRLNQIHSRKQLSFELQGQRHFVEVMPWQDGSGLNWLIVAVIPESDFIVQIQANTYMTLISCAVAMIIAISVSLATARWVITPIQALNQAAKEIARGKWERPIPLDRGDEVGELARSFHQMAAQLQISFDALQDGQQQLARFLEAVPTGICVVEPSGRISYMNQTAQKLLGQTFQSNLLLQSLTTYCQAQIAGTGRSYPIEQLPAMRALQGESSTVEDIEIYRNKQLIPLEMRATPILDAEEKVSYAIVAFQDIHERKQAEKLLADYNRILAAQIAERTAELTHANLELEKAKQTAETANQAKSTFLANMSHELRTPLNAILGFAQIMGRDPQTTPEQQHHLRIINRSGEHLLSLINNVLDLSKIEAGRIDLTETCFNLTELLETIDGILHQHAAAKGLQFQIIVAPKVPRHIVNDAIKLRQVLINLVGNAIKFTEYGSVVLRVRVENVHSDTLSAIGQTLEGEAETLSGFKHQYLVFEVEDTGIGIPTEELNGIFHAFEQSSRGKITPEGTGLGLTISRKFIELMHGTISVVSTSGTGTRFTIKLPIHGTAIPMLDLRSQRLIVGLAPNQPRYRVLIVDDQSENRELLVRMLTSLRLDVREAANGQDAIACYQAWQPHLMLLDIYMPELDGFATTQQIRQLEQQIPLSQADPSTGLHRLKIIALSASILEDDRQKAFAAGCDGFLGKPFQAHDLYKAIGQQLQLRYRYADPTPKTIQLPSHQSANVDSLFSPNQQVGLTQHPQLKPHTDQAAEATLDKVLSPEKASSNLSPALAQPISLDFMPSDWRYQLYQTALCCRDEQVIELIEQIPSEYSALAQRLRTYAQKFQFEMILQLLPGYSRKD